MIALTSDRPKRVEADAASQLRRPLLQRLLPRMHAGHRRLHQRRIRRYGDQGDQQGCQMVYFQTENPNLGKYWNALDWKMLIYFMFICNIFMDLWDIL
jgi:hypothetical protein